MNTDHLKIMLIVLFFAVATFVFTMSLWFAYKDPINQEVFMFSMLAGSGIFAGACFGGLISSIISR